MWAKPFVRSFGAYRSACIAASGAPSRTRTSLDPVRAIRDRLLSNVSEHLAVVVVLTPSTSATWALVFDCPEKTSRRDRKKWRTQRWSDVSCLECPPTSRGSRSVKSCCARSFFCFARARRPFCERRRFVRCRPRECEWHAVVLGRRPEVSRRRARWCGGSNPVETGRLPSVHRIESNRDAGRCIS
jgi:hypothetical protein